MKQDLTFYLATIWGAYFIVGALALLFFPAIRKTIISIAKDDQAKLILGIVLGVVGSLHISFHNIWTSGPELVVTIIGWVLLVKAFTLIMFSSLDNLVEAYFNSKYSSFVYLFIICAGFFLIHSVNPVLKF